MTLPDTVVARQNPYVGTRPFRKGETLYGRERETSELLDLLIAERIVMLYSPSGAGKSSLLNAVILPKMEENRFKVLQVARFNHEPPADLTLPANFNRYVFSILMWLEESVDPEKRFPIITLAGYSLKDYMAAFRARAVELDPNFNPATAVLLVVDQGEEIITIAPTERLQKQDFFNQLGDLLHDRTIWLLYSLREDYIARMDSYIKPVPTGFTTRYRLRLLQAESALPAIQKPAAEQHVLFRDEAAQKLTNDLRMVQVQQADGTTVSEPGLYVEPVQLQVVCRRVWTSLEATDYEIGLDDLEKVGDVDSALADYYALQVASVAAKTGVHERFIRSWFERKLITAQGIRGQVLFAPTRSDGLENTAIFELEKGYLVRSEKRGGSTWFELSHDRLITPILENNADWFDQNLSVLQRQAEVWNDENRPEGMLITGPDFVAMQLWANNNQSEMSQVETDFYTASLSAQKSMLREARNNLIIRWLGIVAFIGAVIAISLFFQARAAEQRAVARELAANSLVNLSVDPELSVMLALASQKVTGEITRENVEALHRALPLVRVEKVLRGHTERVYAARFSPDGRLIASGSKDGRVKIWQVETGKELQTLTVVANPAGGYGVTNLAFKPDGSLLAVSTQDGAVFLYDTVTWQQVRSIPAHMQAIWGLAFSPDGSLLATGSEDYTVKLWDSTNGTLLTTFGVADCSAAACGKGHSGTVNNVTFSPDGKMLVSTGEDASIRVWDVAARQFAFKLGGPNAHTEAVLGLAFSPDGKRLASSGVDRTIKIWDFTTQEWVMNITGHADWVYAVAFTPDGKKLVSSSSDRTIRIWDTTYGRLQNTFSGHSDQVYDVSISADGQRIVSASQDTTVRIWDISLSSSRELLTLNNLDRVNAVAYSRDGSLLASSGRSPDIKIWDAHSGKLVNDLVGHTRVVDGLAWGPDGKWLVSVARDSRAIVWDAASGSQTLVFEKHNKEILAVALSGDGSFAVSGDTSGLIYVWDAHSGQVLHSLQGAYGSVLAVAVSPDQKWVAAGYLDAKVVLWNLADERAQILGEHDDFVETVTFDKTGRLLASSGDDGNLILWNLAAKPPSILSKTQANRGTIYDALFSRDGKYILTGGADGFINIRDISNPSDPRLAYTLYGFTDRVQSMDVNGRDDHVAAGSADGSVRVFTLSPSELTSTASGRLTREMTEVECQDNFNKSCAEFNHPSLLDRITNFLTSFFH